MSKPIDLTHDAVHLSDRQQMIPVFQFEHGYDAYVAKHCVGGEVGRLVTMHTTTENWGSWETHPVGEELVLVLSGRAEFIQLVDGVERRVVVGPHETIINPAGVAHTANVIEPFAALYITPAPGTSHRPRE